MTEPHPNAALLIRALEAFGAGDRVTLDEVFDDDVVWHLAGSSAVSGEYRGKQEVFDGYFARLQELTGGTFRPEAHDVMGGVGHAVLLARATAERESRTLDVNECLVFHISQGRITECWQAAFDQDAWDAFWS